MGKLLCKSDFPVFAFKCSFSINSFDISVNRHLFWRKEYLCLNDDTTFDATIWNNCLNII